VKRTPEVAIIILNWNSGLHTRDCLASLAQLDYGAYWPLVVDNGSTDDSLQRVREAFPEVPILENGRNLGFTGGNNIGLRWALERGADYMLLLNDDTEVAPDFLRQLVERLSGWLGRRSGTSTNLRSSGRQVGRSTAGADRRACWGSTNATRVSSGWCRGT